MTLSGGNPAALTLRQFLSAGFALLVEGYTSLGVSVVEAVEKVNSSLGMGVDEPSAPRQQSVAAKNTAALQEMMAQMAGVKGGPKAGGV